MIVKSIEQALYEMEEQFDGVQFAQYVRRRWAVVVIACIVATAVAGAVCLVLPQRYTATASLLIEPPAGNDPRGATAVSPVYLESLKTYERFASSDTVFATALQELGLRPKFGSAGIESIKRSVLKVSRPTSTKIVEISATLDDPEGAQKLAQHIAEQSVLLNRKLNDQSTEDVLRDVRKTVELAAAHLKKAEQTKNEAIRTEAIDALATEVATANQTRLGIEQDLGKTRAELADMEAEMKTFHAGDGLEEQAKWTSRQIEALRARVVSLQAQALPLAKTSTDSSAILEARRLHRELLDTELHSARGDYELAKTRLSDAQNSAAYRGERLEIMDPGIVPQRPSSPNTPLNVMLAFLTSLIASVAYLAVRFGYSRARRYPTVPEYSMR